MKMFLKNFITLNQIYKVMAAFIEVQLNPKQEYPTKEAKLNIDSIASVEPKGEHTKIIMKEKDEYGNQNIYEVYNDYKSISRKIDLYNLPEE